MKCKQSRSSSCELFLKLKTEKIKSTKNPDFQLTKMNGNPSNIIFHRSIHKPRDSILSWTSEFTNYEGIVNWAFLLLSIGGLRLFLENFNKYGVRVNPKAWFNALFVQLDPLNDNHEYPTSFLLLCKLWFRGKYFVKFYVQYVNFILI